MKRERVLQIFLTVLGILFIALLYPLYTDLWHAKWLVVMRSGSGKLDSGISGGSVRLWPKMA